MSKGPNAILQVNPINPSYFAKYTCEANNKLGTATEDVVLKQAQKPGAVSHTKVSLFIFLKYKFEIMKFINEDDWMTWDNYIDVTEIF